MAASMPSWIDQIPPTFYTPKIQIYTQLRMGNALTNKHLEVHHIALGALDVEAVAQFYSEAFGLPELSRHLLDDGTLRSIWLDCKTFVLMIEAVEATEPNTHMRPGLFLIAFSVTPTERKNVEDWLTLNGYAIEYKTAFSSYSRDPEGNRVAVSALNFQEHLSSEGRS